MHSEGPWAQYWSSNTFERHSWEQETEDLANETRAGEFLREVLRLLPSLHSVILSQLEPDYDVPYKVAVPLPVILAILSTPHVRHFTAHGYLYHPADPIPILDAGLSLSSIVSFTHDLFIFRPGPREVPREAALLNLIIPRLRLSLETLVLAVENAPLSSLQDNDWPRLRELTLSGENREDIQPYITILGRMPQLQSLRLYLAHPARLTSQPIWPDSLPGTFPWPRLEHLTISNPHPEDQLWAHLPRTLKSLALLYYPRFSTIHYPSRWEVMQMNDLCLQWYPPIVSALQMHRLLQCCSNLPNLVELELEYLIDEGEDLLLNHVARACVALEILEIRRYRKRWDDKMLLTPVCCFTDF